MFALPTSRLLLLPYEHQFLELVALFQSLHRVKWAGKSGLAARLTLAVHERLNPLSIRQLPLHSKIFLSCVLCWKERRRPCRTPSKHGGKHRGMSTQDARPTDISIKFRSIKDGPIQAAYIRHKELTF